MSHVELLQSAVIDIDVDLSSLDEDELYETLCDFESENEINWKVKSRAHAFTEIGIVPTDSDWVKTK
jgi:hypothetical protein